MKRNRIWLWAGIGLSIVILYSFMQLSVHSGKPMSEEQKIAASYVKSLGYKIVSHSSKPITYTLEKSLLAPGNGAIPYIQTWSVQSQDPANYYGKEIVTYRFKVSGHPLDRIYNTNTALFVMMSEGKVIGGTSFPDRNDLAGAPYSIDGKTLEEITGNSFGEWREQWAKKYGK